MKEYKISVKLNTMDMYRFLMKHEYGSFSGLFGLAVSILALIALCLGVGAGDRNTQIFLAFFASCFTILNPLRLFFRAQKQISVNPTFHKPVEYTFHEQGMHIAQGDQEMDITWTDTKKLVKGKKIMVLYLSKMVGYIFPRSQCEGRYDEIADFIREQMSEFHETTAQGADEDSFTLKEETEKIEPTGGKRNWDRLPGEADIWDEEEKEQ